MRRDSETTALGGRYDAYVVSGIVAKKVVFGTVQYLAKNAPPIFRASSPGTFQLRCFCNKPLILQWVLGIHSQREKPGLLCWITVAPAFGALPSKFWEGPVFGPCTELNTWPKVKLRMQQSVKATGLDHLIPGRPYCRTKLISRAKT